jgi:site-specific DNA-cytosine methylase
MKIISLFSGAGGLDLGFKPFGKMSTRKRFGKLLKRTFPKQL